MAVRYGATEERESEFQEVYFNKYLTGTLVAPLLRALFHTLGFAFYAPLSVALAVVAVGAPIALLLGWQKSQPTMAAPFPLVQLSLYGGSLSPTAVAGVLDHIQGDCKPDSMPI